MRTAVAIGFALAVLLGPPLAPPSRGADDTELKTQIQRKRVLVHPRPDAQQAVRDTEQTTEGIGARARAEALAREAAAPRLRRPDLGYDVTSGLQQRALGRALSR